MISAVGFSRPWAYKLHWIFAVVCLIQIDAFMKTVMYTLLSMVFTWPEAFFAYPKRNDFNLDAVNGCRDMQP